VPHIAQEAEHVTLYQRTAPWILPKWDSRYGVLHDRVSELLPMALRLGRFAVWLIFELLAVTLVDAKPSLASSVRSRAATYIGRLLAHLCASN
jgi:cyclohexanone monooxygenase